MTDTQVLVVGAGPVGLTLSLALADLGVRENQMVGVPLGRYFAGRKSKAQLREEWKPVARKMRRQIVKDYIVFPALSGKEKDAASGVRFTTRA